MGAFDGVLPGSTVHCIGAPRGQVHPLAVGSVEDEDGDDRESKIDSMMGVI